MARGDKYGFFSRLFRRRPVVPVVRLSGADRHEQVPLDLLDVARQRLESNSTAPSPIKKAASAVALVVNSPGGAPTQSHLIHLRIRQLAEKNKKKVYRLRRRRRGERRLHDLLRRRRNHRR
jgi:serine protease SohB